MEASLAASSAFSELECEPRCTVPSIVPAAAAAGASSSAPEGCSSETVPWGELAPSLGTVSVWPPSGVPGHCAASTAPASCSAMASPSASTKRAPGDPCAADALSGSSASLHERFVPLSRSTSIVLVLGAALTIALTMGSLHLQTMDQQRGHMFGTAGTAGGEHSAAVAEFSWLFGCT